MRCCCVRCRTRSRTGSCFSGPQCIAGRAAWRAVHCRIITSGAIRTRFEGLGGFYYGDFNLSAVAKRPSESRAHTSVQTSFRSSSRRLSWAVSSQPKRNSLANIASCCSATSCGSDVSPAAANVVGREIRLGGESFTVAGVMPQGMPFFDNLPEVELWTPMAFAPRRQHGDAQQSLHQSCWPVETRRHAAQAQSDVSAIARAIEEIEPGNKGVGALIVPLQEQLAGDSRKRVAGPARCCRVCVARCVCERRKSFTGACIGSQ